MGRRGKGNAFPPECSGKVQTVRVDLQDFGSILRKFYVKGREGRRETRREDKRKEDEKARERVEREE